MSRVSLLLLSALALTSCRTDPAKAAATPSPTDATDRDRTSVPPRDRVGDEISVCGHLVPIGVPVILWSDPGGYNAYSLTHRFAAEPGEPKRRFGPRSNLPDAIAPRVASGGWTLEDLQQVVHLFVLHYDMAGTSRQCFKVLHDLRGLSVHFLLDVDGTIYQTLDLKERAWHATIANDHGIGIEIAHPGAYPQPGHPAMRRWYEPHAAGDVAMKLPAWLKEPGIRTPEFVARPTRPGLQSGTIHGKTYYQRDFTEAQYRSLVHLTAGLHRVFPRIPLEVPRTANGVVLGTNLSPDELHAFDGLVGHSHVQRNKIDPGPAFQWERLLREARALVR